jgi:hypothetical protein
VKTSGIARIRDRVHGKRIDEGKDGGGRRDAERDGADRHTRKHPIPPQPPHRVLNVLNDRIDERRPSLLAQHATSLP